MQNDWWFGPDKSKADESKAPTHEEMVKRLKADPQCEYQDDDGDEGVSIVGGIDHAWAKKHMKGKR
jgi:hypothetical protein